MKDQDLECLPNWRFCRIPRGSKGPRYSGWNNLPLALAEVPADGNIGVILGRHSQGLAALDFDGPEAWDWWDKNIGIAIPETITWASGRTGRCQMAFQVPEPYWEYLDTVKITLGISPGEVKPDGFEFRWTGVQSVLPPSLHPDLGTEYFWVRPPTTTALAQIPDELLCYWLQHNDHRPVTDLPVITEASIESVTDAEYRELRALLEQIRQYNAVLAYDDWMNISFSAASVVGNRAAEIIMKELWPERTAGEYRRMLAGRDPARSPTIASLVFRCRQYRMVNDTQARVKYLQDLNEIQQIRQILKEKLDEQT